MAENVKRYTNKKLESELLPNVDRRRLSEPKALHGESSRCRAGEGALFRKKKEQ